MTATSEPPTPGAAQRLPFPTKRLLDGKPRAIMFDASACIGCRQCVEACKDWNELPRGDTYKINPATWLTIEPPVMEGSASVWGRNSCMHCEYPACAAVCPVEAITKYEEGPVVIDASVCIGCEYCVYACPWHVISKDEVTQKAKKCTMCTDRIVDGKDPFCVHACPVGALAFGLVEEMDAQADERAAAASASVYGRREAGGTHVLHVLPQSPREHGLPPVPPVRYPENDIPLDKKLHGLFTLTGGLEGKLRAIRNAIEKPWRLSFRYWHKPGG